MGGGTTPLGQSITRGLDQMRPQQQQGMTFPEFNYKPGKGLSINFGDQMLMSLLQGLQQPQQQMQRSMNMPGQVVSPQMTQMQNMFQKPLPISPSGNYPV